MFSKKAVVSHEVPLPHNRLTHFLHTLQVTKPQKMKQITIKKQIRKKKPCRKWNWIENRN